MRENKVLKGIKQEIDRQFESLFCDIELNDNCVTSKLNKVDLLMLINSKFDRLLNNKEDNNI